MRKRKLLTAIALSFACSACQAGDPKTYIVGVENLSFQPHYGTDAGKYTGYFKDLMDAFAKKEGIKVIYKPMDIDTLYSSFFKGHVDFKYPDDANWRSAYRNSLKITYSNPSVAYVDGTIKLSSNSALTPNSIKSIGKPTGFFMPPYASSIEAGLKVVEYESTEKLIQGLINGEVDAVYHNVDVAMHYVRKQQIKNVAFAPDLPMIQSDYRVSTIKHPDLIQKFNAFLQSEKTLCDSLRDSYGIDAARRATTLKIFRHR